MGNPVKLAKTRMFTGITSIHGIKRFKQSDVVKIRTRKFVTNVTQEIEVIEVSSLTVSPVEFD